MEESKRSTILSIGAAGGLFALAFCESFTIALLFSFVLGLAWLSKWCRGEPYTRPVRLDGKLAVVTGANRGIGYETAKGLAARGARVILACRNVNKAQQAKLQMEQDLKIEGSKLLSVMEVDVSSFKSVRSFANNLVKKEPKIDILIHNAGFAFEPRKMTEDGIEQVFQVNYLSTFLLTHLLLDLLKNAGPDSRVIFLSSIMHKYDKGGIQFDDLKWENTKWNSWKAYGQAKLAILYMVRKLTDELAGTGVTAYAVHPGVVGTDIGKVYMDMVPACLRPLTDLSMLFMKTLETGAATSLYCAAEPDLPLTAVGGSRYYADCAESDPDPLALDRAATEKLWEVSISMLGGPDAIKPLPPKEGAAVPPIPVPVETPKQEVTSKSEPVEEILMAEETPMQKVEDIKQEVVEVKEDILVETIVTEEAQASTEEEISAAAESSSESEVAGDEDVDDDNDMEFHGGQLTVTSDPVEHGIQEVEKNSPSEESQDLPVPDEAKASLLVDIQSFQAEEQLTPVKSASKEPMSGLELLQRDVVMRGVEQFNKDEGLQHVAVTEEKTWLPDANTIQEEKTRQEHLTGIEQFGAQESPLKHVKTPEPLSGVELLQHELVTRGVEQFDKETGLKHVEVAEKTWIPDPDTIQEERARVEHLASIETFGSTEGSLKHVKTPEPMSGAELLKHELMAKDVAGFDKETGLKHVDQVVEKNWLPDSETIKEEKTRQEHLTGIEQFGAQESPLKHVKTPEPLSGLELLQHELVTRGVEQFDKETGLKHVEVTEKTWIPDPDTIQDERTRMEHLTGIEQFASKEGMLKPVKTQEPLSGAELLKMEMTQKAVAAEVESFDRSSMLQHADTEVKSQLPNPQEIQEEKTRYDLLKSVEEFSTDNLTRVSTKEPMSSVELVEQELRHEKILEEVVASAHQLKQTTTEEKNVLPDSDSILQEKQHIEHLQGIESFDSSQLRHVSDPQTTSGALHDVDLLGSIEDSPPSEMEQPVVRGAELLRQELLAVREPDNNTSGSETEERERRSSSEEWEKISAGEVEQSSQQQQQSHISLLDEPSHQPPASDC